MSYGFRKMLGRRDRGRERDRGGDYDMRSSRYDREGARRSDTHGGRGYSDDYTYRINATLDRGREKSYRGRSADRYADRYSDDDYDEYDDYDDDDYHSSMDGGGDDMFYLSKRDMMEWKKDLVNADGTQGEHFQKEPLMQAAKDMGIDFSEFEPKTLCLTANMLYSDYCAVLRGYIPSDKELYIYVGMAKAFLDDPDSEYEGDEKLAAYYHCVVKACDD